MMKSFREIQPKEWQMNPFQTIGEEWMLIAAEKDGACNAMTASWGGVGVLWGKNAAYIFVRKSRYTKEFIDAADRFSLTFYDRPRYTSMLSYMGKTSGRNEDKIARAGLTVCHEGETPYFAEANTVLICRKMAMHPIAPDGFIDPAVDGKFYADHDYHDMYVAEIEKILVEE